MFVLTRIGRRGGGNVVFLPMGLGGGRRRRLTRRGRLRRRRAAFPAAAARRAAAAPRGAGDDARPSRGAADRSRLRCGAGEDARADRLRARRAPRWRARPSSCSGPASWRCSRRCRCCCSPSFRPSASIWRNCWWRFSRRCWGRCPGSAPWLIPRRAVRSACHRAALAQFVVRGLDRSQGGVLVYVSLAEHYIRIVPAEDAALAVSHERGRRRSTRARAARRRRTEEALTGLAARSAEILSKPFPPGTSLGAAAAVAFPHGLMRFSPGGASGDRLCPFGCSGARGAPLWGADGDRWQGGGEARGGALVK